MQSMKSKTHSHSGNGNATNSGGSSSPSPPQSSHRKFNISHYRYWLRSKAFFEMKKLGSFTAGIIGRRNLRYFFLLPMLYFSGLLMYGCPFSALIGRAPIPRSVYPSHEILQKLWPDIEADNSTAIEGQDTVGTSCVEQGTIKVGGEDEILGLMQTSQMWYIPKKNIFSKQDDVLAVTERYMEEHGTEAFERLITKANREARARRNGNYMIFDDDHADREARATD